MKKRIKINHKYEIRFRWIFLLSVITFLECLCIIGINNWKFIPTVFVPILNMIFAIKKRSEEMDLKEFEERLKALEEKAKEDEDI